VSEKDNVHILKTKLMEQKEQESMEALYKRLSSRLETRLNKIEKNLKTAVQKIEIKDQQQNINYEEIDTFIDSVESRLKHVIDEFQEEAIPSGSRRHKKTDRRKTKVFMEQAESLLNLLNLKTFKSFLSSMWYGQSADGFQYDDFGLDLNFLNKVKPFFDFLYYNYWRVTPHGLHNIPNKGRGLIVANHSGTLPYDGSMICEAIINDHTSRRNVRFLVEDFVYHFPFLGTFMYRIGGVRASQENAQRLLNQNNLVVVFPEGVKGIGKHFKNRYQLQRFGRGGFIKLAMRTGAPIIPTAVIGAEEIHPIVYKSTLLAKPLRIPYLPVTPTLPALGPLGLIPLPSKWAIIFGEPIDFSQYGPEAVNDNLLINKLSEMVRARIQSMIVGALKDRRSIWFG
jgi:1-acyl-sn-glycerol-3-phosphate acyltransferase